MKPKKSAKTNVAVMGDALLKGHRFAYTENGFYVWMDGCWQQKAIPIIKKFCALRMGKAYKKSKADEVVEYIKSLTYIEPKEPPINLIPLKNGILDLDTMTLCKPDPENFFTYKLPVNYDPNCVCPAIERFLGEISDNAKLLIEFAAYCLHRGYPIHVALMLVGKGNNGKSTYLRLLKRFFGPKNVSAVTLQSLCTNRFASAQLHRKMANIACDIPKSILWDTSAFKGLTGEDSVFAEHKFRDSFTFENYAKLIFSCNALPETRDRSSAFYDRWLILNFTQVFKGENRDPKLISKLTTPAELSGFLNLCLEALPTVVEGEFSYSETDTKRAYDRVASSVAGFAMDCLKVEPKHKIAKSAVYPIYVEYCVENTVRAVSEDHFWKTLPNYIAYGEQKLTVKITKPKEPDKEQEIEIVRQRYLSGITLAVQPVQGGQPISLSKETFSKE